MKVSRCFNSITTSILILMQVAVEGCCHGELDDIYAHISKLETQHAYKVDLLLICGDFQAVRNHRDLQCMAVPNKYKALQTFYKCVILLYVHISDSRPLNPDIIPARRQLLFLLSSLGETMKRRTICGNCMLSSLRPKL